MEQDKRFAAPASDDGRYRMLVESITDYAVFMLDPNGIVATWNPGAARIKGYAEAEIVGRHFSVFYTDADRAAGLPARMLATAVAEGRAEAEGWRRRKDGTRFWAQVVIDTVEGPGGEVVGFAKVTRDLTRRRDAEEALRRSEAQFRLLVQGVVDYAIYMIDQQGNVVSWNLGARRIKGYDAEEIVGRHFSAFYTPEDRAAGKPRTALETAAREGRFETEGWRLRKDGTRFFAHVVVDAIRDADGVLVGFAKVTRDVTERMEAQRSLEEAREALLQSQKMEALGQITGGVAHDFNNLLAAVIGSLELLELRTPDDERLRGPIASARRAAERGAALTRRMLAFARRQDLKVEPVDVAALMAGMGDLLAGALGPSVRLATDVPADLPPVSTDPVNLETAILNLALNARDAMPGGGGLTISARLEDVADGAGLAAGRYVRIAVEDEGEGMDPATLARASEPFFTTKGVGKGTGLGLSMVHGLAAQSGGDLSIRSRPGAGTRVEIRLPATTRAPAAQPWPVPEAGAPARPLRVLVVDDDVLVLTNTALMLEDLGHTAVEATSGAEALGILAGGEAFDLVVTDQAMPGMTGTDLAARIRSEHGHLPVVLSTGYSRLPPGAGADLPRLAKPFTLRDLAEVVERATSPA